MLFRDWELEGCPKWKIEAGRRLSSIFPKLHVLREEQVYNSDATLTNIVNIVNGEFISC